MSQQQIKGTTPPTGGMPACTVNEAGYTTCPSCLESGEENSTFKFEDLAREVQLMIEERTVTVSPDECLIVCWCPVCLASCCCKRGTPSEPQMLPITDDFPGVVRERPRG